MLVLALCLVLIYNAPVVCRESINRLFVLCRLYTRGQKVTDSPYLPMSRIIRNI